MTPGTAQGTFVVAYDVTVSNPSTTTGVSYDLTDTPAFPAQVTISEPTASVVRSNLDGSGAGASTAIDGLGQRWTVGHRYRIAGRQEGHLPGVRAGHRACGYSDDGARVFRVDVGARLLQRGPDDQWRGRL